MGDLAGTQFNPVQYLLVGLFLAQAPHFLSMPCLYPSGPLFPIPCPPLLSTVERSTLSLELDTGLAPCAEHPGVLMTIMRVLCLAPCRQCGSLTPEGQPSGSGLLVCWWLGLGQNSKDAPYFPLFWPATCNHFSKDGKKGASVLGLGEGRRGGPSQVPW